MHTRRLGRLGHDSSVIIYGGAMLANVTQDVADRSIQQALDGGVNHFDVAASYGDAELRLGPWVPRIRADIFLATKTEQRDAENAWRQINASLERLQTDSVDLIQIHAVTDLGQLDSVTRPGGSLESAVRARDEGMAKAVGITGHGHQAPATHLEALRRYDFDSVLTPINYTLSKRDDYYRSFLELAEETRRRDVALMTIKTAARRNWTDRSEGATHPQTTWYEPLTDARTTTAAVAWVLSHEAITGIPCSGDVTLLGNFLAAERDGATMSVAEAANILDGVPEMSSPFQHSI